MKYFLWNKQEDFETGVHVAPGYYVSRLLDSRMAETVWHRMAIHLELGDNMAVDVCIYSWDDGDAAVKIMEWIGQGDHDIEAVRRRMAPYEKLSFHNPSDVLLHQISSRYLWFSIRMWGHGLESPVVKGIQIWFPMESWISFLPECYQTERNGFLERYLAVFETLYREIEEDIRGNSRYLDIEVAPVEALEWLAQWLDMSHIHLWSETKLRSYLKEGAGAYAYRGTRRGLESLVLIYTGEKPYIVEAGEGEHPYECRLYIREQAVNSMKEYRALNQVIREGKPAHMDVKVCVLRPYIYLNQDSYVGINSVLNHYHTGVLDGNAMMSCVTLGRRND